MIRVPLPSMRRAWVGILLFGLLWRIAVALWVYPIFQPGSPRAGDSDAYVALAQNLLAGHGYTIDSEPPFTPYVYRPPTYPLFLAGTLFLGGGSHAVAVGAQILLDLATAVVLFALARTLWPARKSLQLLVLTLWATCPAVGSFAGRLLAEVLATFLTAAAAWLLIQAALRSRWPRFVWGAGAGVALMSAALARPQLALTAIVLPILVALRPPLGGERGMARRALLLAAVLGGMLVVEVPWLLRNLNAIGSPVVLAHGPAHRAFAMGLADRERVETTAQVNERLSAMGLASEGKSVAGGVHLGPALAHVRRDPQLFIAKSLERAVLLWASPRTSIYSVTPTEIRHALAHPRARMSLGVLVLSGMLGLYYFSLLALAVAGGLRYARNPAVAALIVALPVAVTLVGMWFHLESRYVLPAFPAVILLSALALDDFLGRRVPPRVSGRGPIARVLFGIARRVPVLPLRRGWVLGALAALTVGHVLVLGWAFGPYLDDQPVNDYSERGDAYDYVARAERLASQSSLADAFADRYRMPGYPIFLSFFIRRSAEPLHVARVVQVLLASLIVPLSFVVLRRSGLAARFALGVCLAIGLWAPLYYFAPILIPESLSLFLVAGLLVALAYGSRRWVLMVTAVPVLIALLTYLKPNHLLLLLPCLAFFLRGPARRRVRLAGGAAMLVLSAALVLPWLRPGDAGFFGVLTSAQGKNLLQGTGAATVPDSDALHDRLARALELYDPAARALHEKRDDPQRWAPIQEEAGLRVWRSRPFATAAYGLAKCGHALGFSFRDGRDLLNALLLAASLGSAWLLHRRRSPGAAPWVAYYAITLGVVLMQACIFLPNQRFKVVLFDLPALILIALGAYRLWQERSRLRYRAWSASPFAAVSRTRSS